MIKLTDWITSSEKYPERLLDPELTEEVLLNATGFLEVLNNFLEEITPGVEYKVSSGFRPSHINAKLIMAAKRSFHITGLAVDLVDANDQLDKLIVASPELLQKYSLWLEHPSETPGWCHLDMGQRTARKIRIFKP